MIQNSWTLTDRQFCDCEMILDGSFSPLNRFMNRSDYDQVLKNMRLSTGELFPLPITLDVNKQFSEKLKLGEEIVLREKEGFKVARMTIESIWEPDFNLESKLVYGTVDQVHPAVNYLFSLSNTVYIGGKVEKISMPNHYDYRELRLNPSNVKKQFKELGWDIIVAFQTRNPLHRAHIEMTIEAMKNLNAKLLLHPVVGITKPGDVDHFTRVRCYQHVIEKYPKDSAFLALLPLAMRMGGPREALLHALIRKNFGCTHFLVGRDHAGVGNYYGEYDAQNLCLKYQDELNIKINKGAAAKMTNVNCQSLEKARDNITIAVIGSLIRSITARKPWENVKVSFKRLDTNSPCFESEKKLKGIFCNFL